MCLPAGWAWYLPVTPAAHNKHIPVQVRHISHPIYIISIPPKSKALKTPKVTFK